MPFSSSAFAIATVNLLRSKREDSAPRNYFHLKSGNKCYFTEESCLRQKAAKAAINEFRKQGFPPTHSNYGLYSMDHAEAANCWEYANAAHGLITRMGGMAAIFRAERPADHVICIVGMDENMKIFNKFSLATDDAWVCDPWANIACPIMQYWTNLDLKLEKWGRNEKMIHWKKEWCLANSLAYKSALLQTTFERWSHPDIQC